MNLGKQLLALVLAGIMVLSPFEGKSVVYANEIQDTEEIDNGADTLDEVEENVIGVNPKEGGENKEEDVVEDDEKISEDDLISGDEIISEAKEIEEDEIEAFTIDPSNPSGLRVYIPSRYEIVSWPEENTLPYFEDPIWPSINLYYLDETSGEEVRYPTSRFWELDEAFFGSADRHLMNVGPDNVAGGDDDFEVNFYDRSLLAPGTYYWKDVTFNEGNLAEYTISLNQRTFTIKSFAELSQGENPRIRTIVPGQSYSFGNENEENAQQYDVFKLEGNFGDKFVATGDVNTGWWALLGEDGKPVGNYSFVGNGASDSNIYILPSSGTFYLAIENASYNPGLHTFTMEKIERTVVSAVANWDNFPAKFYAGLGYPVTDYADIEITYDDGTKENIKKANDGACTLSIINKADGSVHDESAYYAPGQYEYTIVIPGYPVKLTHSFEVISLSQIPDLEVPTTDLKVTPSQRVGMNFSGAFFDDTYAITVDEPTVLWFTSIQKDVPYQAYSVSVSVYREETEGAMLQSVAEVQHLSKAPSSIKLAEAGKYYFVFYNNHEKRDSYVTIKKATTTLTNLQLVAEPNKKESVWGKVKCFPIAGLKLRATFRDAEGNISSEDFEYGDDLWRQLNIKWEIHSEANPSVDYWNESERPAGTYYYLFKSDLCDAQVKVDGMVNLSMDTVSEIHLNEQLAVVKNRVKYSSEASVYQYGDSYQDFHQYYKMQMDAGVEYRFTFDKENGRCTFLDGTSGNLQNTIDPTNGENLWVSYEPKNSGVYYIDVDSSADQNMKVTLKQKVKSIRAYKIDENGNETEDFILPYHQKKGRPPFDGILQFVYEDGSTRDVPAEVLENQYTTINRCTRNGGITHEGPDGFWWPGEFNWIIDIDEEYEYPDNYINNLDVWTDYGRKNIAIIPFTVEGKVKPYTIKYNGNNVSVAASGGSVTGSMPDQKMPEYSENLAKNKFKAEGFQFLGWNEKIVPVLPYNATDEEIEEAVEYKDGKQVIPISTGGKTVTLYAVWREETYAITYHLNGAAFKASFSPKTIYRPFETAGNNEVELPSLSDLEEVDSSICEFAGWYFDSNYKKEVSKNTSGKYVLNNGEKGDKNIYAKWILKDVTITFVDTASEKSLSQKTRYNALTTLKKNTFKNSGYGFVGWSLINPNSAEYPKNQKEGFVDYSNGVNYLDGVQIRANGDITLYAIWQNYFALDYELDGGKFDASVVVPYSYQFGKITKLPTPKKLGYTFAGWYVADNNGKDKKISSIGKKTVGNMRLTAKWTENTYTIAFNKNGGTGKVSSVKVKYTELDSVPAPLKHYSRKGQEQKGWALDKNKTGDAADFALTAIDAVYDVNAALVSQLSEEALEKALKKNKATIKLYAVWNGREYTVDFDTNDMASAISQLTYRYKEVGIDEEELPIPKIKDEYAAKYTFGGWYTTPNLKKKVTKISKNDSKDYVLYAKWNRPYTIVFHSNNGLDEKVIQTMDAGVAKALKANAFKYKTPEATYAFQGWAVESDLDKVVYQNKIKLIEPRELRSSEDDELHLYAVWRNSLTLTLDGNGGNFGSVSGASISFTYGVGVDGKTLAEQVPAREGYTFGGWCSDVNGKKKVTSIGAKVGKDTILYAKWNPKKYKVNLITGKLDGYRSSKTVKTQSLTYQKAGKLAANTIKVKGLRFMGWSTDSKFEHYTYLDEVARRIKLDGLVIYFDRAELNPDIYQDEITLYAVWALEEYTYALHYNGIGGKDTETKFNLQHTLVLPTPSQLGYTFEGWYADKDFKKKVTSLSYGNTNDINLYAKWKLNN